MIVSAVWMQGAHSTHVKYIVLSKLLIVSCTCREGLQKGMSRMVLQMVVHVLVLYAQEIARPVE